MFVVNVACEMEEKGDHMAQRADCRNSLQRCFEFDNQLLSLGLGKVVAFCARCKCGFKVQS